MSKISLDIISQEKKLLTAEVDSITAPASCGDVTILPQHIPLFTKLNDGVIMIKNNGAIDEFAVLGGFMDVGPDSKVTILADAAVRADDINIAKAEEAKRVAEEVMKNKESEISFKEAEASLRKALLELKVANKRRSTGKLTVQQQ
jgi:F-type H+-transporting ATPase subunit epsilon